MISAIAQWLSAHSLPCVYKQLFGISCLACGGQRAIILLLQGEFWQSVKMYPPLFPLLITLLWIIIVKIIRKPLKTKEFTALLIIDAVILLGNCICKNLM